MNYIRISSLAPPTPCIQLTRWLQKIRAKKSEKIQGIPIPFSAAASAVESGDTYDQLIDRYHHNCVADMVE
jgi:hypothetical protein